MAPKESCSKRDCFAVARLCHERQSLPVFVRSCPSPPPNAQSDAWPNSAPDATVNISARRFSRAIDATLHRTDSTIADLGCLFIRQARRADQDQGFPLVMRKSLQRLSKVQKIHVAGLRGRGGKARRV